MGERFAELGPNVDAALITFSDPKYLRSYRNRTDWEHPILTDADLGVYHQFGYHRGSVWRVWGWRTLRRYAGIIRQNGFGALDSSTEDTLQLGGNAVIAPDGRATWIYRGAGPDDRPSFEEIVDEVRKAQSSTPGR